MDVNGFWDTVSQCLTSSDFISRATDILKQHGFGESDSERPFFLQQDSNLVAKNIIDDKPPVVLAVRMSPDSARISSLSPVQIEFASGVRGSTFVGRDLNIVAEVRRRDSDGTIMSRREHRLACCTCTSSSNKADTRITVVPAPSMKEYFKSIESEFDTCDIAVTDFQPPFRVGVDESLMCGQQLGDFAVAYVALLTFCDMKKSSILVIESAQTPNDANWVSKSLGDVKCELIVNVSAFIAERPEFEPRALELGGGVGLFVPDGRVSGGVPRVEAAAQKAGVNISRRAFTGDVTWVAGVEKMRSRCEEAELALPTIGQCQVRHTIALDDVVALDRLLRALFIE